MLKSYSHQTRSGNTKMGLYISKYKSSDVLTGDTYQARIEDNQTKDSFLTDVFDCDGALEIYLNGFINAYRLNKQGVKND